MEKGILENHTDEILYHLAALDDMLRVYKHILDKDLTKSTDIVKNCQDIMNKFKHIAVRLDTLQNEKIYEMAKDISEERKSE